MYVISYFFIQLNITLVVPKAYKLNVIDLFLRQSISLEQRTNIRRRIINNNSLTNKNRSMTFNIHIYSKHTYIHVCM